MFDGDQDYTVPGWLLNELADDQALAVPNTAAGVSKCKRLGARLRDNVSPVPDTTYCTYSNRETWLVGVWLDNHRQASAYVDSLTRQAAEGGNDYPSIVLGELLEDYVTRATGCASNIGKHHGAADLLDGLAGIAVDNVEWYELAGGYLAEFDLENPIQSNDEEAK